MSEELVSVIVPVYNINECVQRCVDSIIRQTYRYLEIILVDDGSTDDSGDICDKYQKYDERIVVFHKENGGLSDARNYAIDRARGEYLAFIDGDDVVHRCYIQILLENLIKNKADISVCCHKSFSDDSEVKKIIEKKVNNKETQVYDSVAAITDMWYRKNITTSAWGKLYKREVIKNVRYPKGLLCEDLATTYRYFYNADKIVFDKHKLYYYFERPGSIFTSKFLKMSIDRTSISEELLKWSVQTGDQKLIAAANSRNFTSCLQGLKDAPFSDESSEYLRYLYNSLPKHRKDIITDSNAGIKNRLMALISFIGAKRIRSIILLGKCIRRNYK